jgi:basic membrane protein A
MLNKRRCAIALLLSLAALSMPAYIDAAPRTASHARAPLRVGLVLDVNGRDDEGFNQLAYEGAVMARSVYAINFDYVEASAGSTPIYAQNLERFARQGYDLVIGVGFLMAQAMLQAARAFPHTDFALVDSAPADASGRTVNMKNVANLFFREQESGYLVGYMAGLMEKEKVGAARHNTIGAMGGVSIPPVNRYIAGYIQGARAADPGIKILLGYSGSFTAEPPAFVIGLDQIARGADILFQVAGSSGLGYLRAAQQKHVYGIGVDADQSYLGSYIMTSALKKVDQAIVGIVGDVASGSFKGGDINLSLKNDATGYGTVGMMVPQSIIAQVNAQARLIAAGKLVPTTVIPAKL